MKIKNLVLSGVLFGSTAWAGQPPGAVDIKQARLQQNAAIVRHDLEAIASYWTDDVTICRGLGLQLAGKAAYRKLFEGDSEMFVALTGAGSGLQMKAAP